MAQVLILADDLTGSLDVGVKFAEQGIPTQIFTAADTMGSFKSSSAEVIVVNTSTRHLAPNAARDTIKKIVTQYRRSFSIIFKKTDSALRGNVGAELAAVLDGSGQDQLCFIPAYPEIGRVTLQGTHYINGVPLHESVFGADPFEPVLSSSVLDILAKQASLPLVSIPVGNEPPAQFKGIPVFDCQTSEQMAHIVKTMYETGRLGATAGCAGLANALSQVLKPASTPHSEGPVLLSNGLLVVCGSINPITQAQLTHVEGADFPRRNIDVQWQSTSDYIASNEFPAFVDDLCRIYKERKKLIVSTGDSSTSGCVDPSKREQVATSLAQTAKAMLDKGVRATFLVTGGDTLEAFLDAIHCRHIIPVCELDPGSVLTLVQYQGCEYQVITKSGGSGGKDLLQKLEKLMKTA